MKRSSLYLQYITNNRKILGILKKAIQLYYTNISAPAGQIARKSFEFGQRVQPATPLMAMVSNDLWVVANFKETQLANMKPG
ncbi:hypothetical protein QUA42_00420 [Microcoleus sp. Pol11C2]|uniref:hypothetical protein n=1 Tax=Microcoleus sp. Pol11C2 TaxID=3055389 RepID=UPI002FCEB2F6